MLFVYDNLSQFTLSVFSGHMYFSPASQIGGLISPQSFGAEDDDSLQLFLWTGYNIICKSKFEKYIDLLDSDSTSNFFVFS